MNTAKFVYVVIDDKKVTHIVKNRESLIALLCDTENPDIRTFSTLEGAEQFKKQYDEKGQNKAQQQASSGIKKYKDSQESPKRKIVASSSSQSSQKKAEPKTDEEIAKMADFGNAQGPRLKSKEDIYSYYVEKDEEMAAAKEKINPSEFYTLIFHGGAKIGETGGASFEIFDPKQDPVYSDKVLGLNQVTGNEAQYCGLIYGLKAAISLGIKKLNVWGNCQLVIEQMNKTFKVGSGMALFNSEANSLASKLTSVTYTQRKKY